jgi:hypothetical protein
MLCEIGELVVNVLNIKIIRDIISIGDFMEINNNRITRENVLQSLNDDVLQNMQPL